MANPAEFVPPVTDAVIPSSHLTQDLALVVGIPRPVPPALQLDVLCFWSHHLLLLGIEEP